MCNKLNDPPTSGYCVLLLSSFAHGNASTHVLATFQEYQQATSPDVTVSPEDHKYRHTHDHGAYYEPDDEHPSYQDHYKKEPYDEQPYHDHSQYHHGSTGQAPSTYDKACSKHHDSCPCPANMMVQQILDFAGPHEDQPFNSSSPLAINGVLVDSTCKKDSFTLALWNTSFVYSCDSLTVHFSQPQSSVSFFIAVGRGEGCSCRAQSFGVDTVDVTGQTTSTRVELLANLANVLPAATVVVNAVPFTTMTISQFAGDVCPEKTQSSKDQLGKQYLYTNCPFIFGQMAYFDYLCANNRPTSRESTTVPNWLRVTEQSSGMVQ